MTTHKLDLISIVELANHFKIQKHTPYFYYIKKLLKPVYIAKGKSGIVLFDREDAIRRIGLIIKYRQVGRSLEEIAKMLNKNDENS